MAQIKSALELALERTKNLKLDEAAMYASKAKTEGRKAAGRYLEAPETSDLESGLRAVEPEQREVFRRAIFDVLAAQIQLPSGSFDAVKFEVAAKGLGVAVRLMPVAKSGAAAEKQALGLLKQISDFLSKYVEEVQRVEQAIRTQWAPKLKEKERQMAARMGQDVRLDPMKDPEFAQFYKQNVETLRNNYRDALERAKEDLAAIAGFQEEPKD
jgi:hypothetical protein